MSVNSIREFANLFLDQYRAPCLPKLGVHSRISTERDTRETHSYISVSA